LRQLFTKTIEFRKTAERNRTPIQISRNPLLSDSNGWLEFFEDVYEVSDIISLSISVESPFAPHVKPKIYRSATAEIEKQILYTGSALFSNTGIFQQERIK
jgi:hypothetical protein